MVNKRGDGVTPYINMSQSIIADNWSLQNITELLGNGMDDSGSHYIKINKASDSYSYEEIAASIINTEALFDLVADIILRDQILVDEKFISAWVYDGGPLQKAVEEGVIRPYPFLVDYERLEEPRNEFIKKLSLTSDLIQDHEENRVGWNQRKSTPHLYLSQVLWGGAGMLARGFVYEKGYTPHPVRKRFFSAAGVLLPSDPVRNLNALISEKRASVTESQTQDRELYELRINMPPLPIRVIQESSSPSDFITVALQLRSEYQELRDWLNCYQLALTDGSYKDIKKFTDVIRSISKYVDSAMGVFDKNAPTFTVGYGVLKVAIKGQPINSLVNQFGIRSAVNKLIISRTGDSDLKKYLNFFGEKNSVVGMKIIEHFSA